MRPKEERRRFKRLAFSARDEIFGEVGFPDPSVESKVLKIADIGAGGLRFIRLRTASCRLKSGDTIILQQIIGHKKLEFLAEVLLEVKWILDDSAFEHVMIGCEFSNIPPSHRQQIADFVQKETSKILPLQTQKG